MKELICIVCPKGCHLRAEEDGGTVTGHSCPRGEAYARAELTNPTRVLTTTVRCTGGVYPRCPVKTDRPIPKGLLFRAMEELDGVELAAPVEAGQVAAENICGTGANVVTTRRLEQREENERE